MQVGFWGLYFYCYSDKKIWLYTLFGGICHIVGLISERNKKSKRTELKSDTLAKIKIL